MKVAILATVVSVALICPASVQAYDTPYFVELPPVSGYYSNIAQAVSADGGVVVGTSVSHEGGYHSIAWRWTPQGGLENLGYLPGGSQVASANDISADGSVIVGHSDSSLASPGYEEAFRWTAETGMVSMPRVPGTVHNSRAEAISADGSTIVGFSNGFAAAQHAVRWTNAGQQIDVLAPMSYSDGLALDVSANGSAITGYAGPAHHFLYWTEEGGADNSVHTDTVSSGGSLISADGSTVYGVDALGDFLWTAAEGRMYLDAPPGDGIFYPAAMTGDASILAGIGHLGYGLTGIVWDASSGYRDINEMLATDYGLDLVGVHIKRIEDISADGTVMVGVTDSRTAYILVLPEPGTSVLLVVGLMIISPRRSAQNQEILDNP